MLGLLATLALPLFLAGGGDDEKGELPAVDPYTEQEPERIERAGYVAYAPFRLVGGQPTYRVDEIVGQKLIWIETQHFRLASSLGTYKLGGDKREKKLVRDELERLGEKLEGVPKRPGKLDPWLRAHLYAQRLEELYAEFCKRFGVQGQDVLLPDGAHALPGPYLGQPEKFIVMLCEKQSTVGRYGARFLTTTPEGSVRHFYPEGAFFFAASTEALGDYDTDSALFVNMTYGVVGNLVDAFRAFHHETPVWWYQGLSHWFSRQVDERWCLYSSYRPQEDGHWKWDARMRKRVMQDYFPGSAEMFSWSHTDKIDLGRQLTSWSRVDYLLAEQAENLPAFLFALKGPLPTDAEGDPRVALQHRAFSEALGLTPDELDERWAAWVRKKYPRR